MTLRKITTALLITLISLLVIGAVTKRASQKTAIINRFPEREVTPAPITIQKIIVDDKEVSFEVPFLASQEWVKTLQVEVRNTSKDRTFLHVVIGVTFSDDSIPEQELSAGFPHFSVVAEKDAKETLTLNPGQSVRLKWSADHLKFLGDRYKDKIASMTSLQLFPLVAINSDRKTGWFWGEEGYRWDADRWVFDRVDITDPAFQKTRQPGYKPALPKPRWDEESGQYVLDSGQQCAITLGTHQRGCFNSEDPDCPTGGVCQMTQYEVIPDCQGSPQCKKQRPAILQCKKLVAGQWVLCDNCWNNGYQWPYGCPIL